MASHGDQSPGHDSEDGRGKNKGQIPNATFAGLDIADGLEVNRDVIKKSEEGAAEEECVSRAN